MPAVENSTVLDVTVGAVGAELDAVDGGVEGRGEEVALHGAAEVRRRVLVEAVGREREGGQRAALDLGAVVALAPGWPAGTGDCGSVALKRVGPVGPRRVRVAAVEARAGDADQGVLVGVARFDRRVRAGPPEGPSGVRRAAPPGVAAVVDRVQVARPR